MEKRFIRLITILGLCIFTILSVTSSLSPKKLLPTSAELPQSEVLSNNGVVNTNPTQQIRHIYTSHYATHHQLSQAIEQTEEVFLKNKASVKHHKPSIALNQPYSFLKNSYPDYTLLSGDAAYAANQSPATIERYILFRDFRI